MLKILLGPTVMSWLDSSLPVVGREPSLQRIDCHLRKSEESCSNFCVWKDETKQCLLHVPELIPLGMGKVPARDVLIAKLFEELIRFPLQRQQLLKQKVSRYQKLRDAFRQGNQYIVAENMPAWTELLRATWQDVKYEEPKFFEELRVGADQPFIGEGEEEQKEPLLLQVLPPVLQALFQKKANSLYFFPMNILEVLGDLKINLFRLITETDMSLDMPVPTTIEQVQWIANQLQLSVFVLPYEEGNDILSIGNILLARMQKLGKDFKPFLCIILLPNGQTGIVSPSPERIEPVPIEFFPKTIQTRILVSKKGKNVTLKESI